MDAGGAGDAGSSNAPGRCGDGTIDAGEECDDAGSTSACGTDCRARTCQLGCRCWSEGGDLITFCTTALGFEAAVESCVVAGGVLNVPESAAENARLGRELARTDHARLWIGGTDAAEEGIWRTLEGDVFWNGGSSGGAVDGRFVAWADGQPNDSASEQQCAALGERGDWDDFACLGPYVFSCRTREVPRSGCGDGKLDAGEGCDSGAETSDCDADCTLAVCGDGRVNVAAGEACDGGAQGSGSCDADCQLSGLVVHLPLDERRGPLAHDVALWARVGELFGDATFTSSADGVTLDSDGYILLPIETRPAQRGRITVMAYARPGGMPQALQNLVEFYEAGEETFLRFNGPVLQAGVWAEGAPWTATYDMAGSLAVGEFTHFTGSYDGARWRLYVNASEVAEFETNFGPRGERGSFVVGGREDLSRGFIGKIADVRVYDRALTDAEIRAVYDEVSASR